MNLLTIAGSDPSSGAGIQSDIKTFTSLGGYALTAVTSITSQNTRKFGKIEPVSQKMVKLQLESIFSDFKIDAVKIGMVYNSEIIRAIHSVLSKFRLPIVLDPVIKATTGGLLLKKQAFEEYKKRLVPLAYVITPNVTEASMLVNELVKSEKDLLRCALKIKQLGAKNVVITGFESKKNQISDFVLEDSKFYSISGKKISQINHGSGCNFSSSLTVAIARGKSLRNSVKFAKMFTFNSIKNSKKIGKGVRITNSPYKADKNKLILEKSIDEFKKIKKIYSVIPECQTNFVFSKEKTKTINDIIGITGRIVKAGKEIVVAGSLEYGGSRHVGTALLEMRKKFPTVRAALNLKYDPKIISKLIKLGYKIESYDRTKEPKKIKRKENSTISWGLTKVIKNSKVAPDVVFHKGDVGKEPMIILFGLNPNELVEKVSKIL